jgi:hypothetical protein
MKASEVGGNHRVIAWTLGLLLLVLMAIPASAQEAGSILGVIKDSSGGVVPNAKVTVTDTATGNARTIQTGSDGAYRVPGLRPGLYSLKVEAQGFQTQTQTGLTLNVAQQLVSNATLQVGAATQEVTVTGEAPVINTTTSSVGGLVNDQQISELPLNGRNYTDLTLLQPGVAQTTHNGLGDTGLWYSSNGAHPRANNYTLDGALINNKQGTGPAGVTGTALGVSGIKEYRVLTNSPSAEYGLVMGSQTVIVSKGGSNNWHGEVFEYLRNNHLDARNFFDPDPSLIPGSYNRLPQFKRNNFGGSVGGPIQKDKTFFFLTYEGVRLQQGDTVQDTVLPTACHVVNNNGNTIIIGGGPISASALAAIQSRYPNVQQQILQGPLSGTTTLADVSGLGLDSNNCLGQGAGVSVVSLVQPWIGQFPLPNEPGHLNFFFPGVTHAREDYAQLRIDHNFSASDTFFARYTFDDGITQVPFYSNFGTGNTGVGFPQFPGRGKSRNQYITLGENHIFSANTLNTLRVSFSRVPYRDDFTNVNTPLNPDFLLQDAPDSLCVTRGAPGDCIWSFIPGQVTGGFNPGSGVTNYAPFGVMPSIMGNNVWTISDDVFYTHGKHAFKFGTLVSINQSPFLQSKGALGTAAFSGIADFLAGIPANWNAVVPGESVALNPGTVGPGASLLAPPFSGNALDKNASWKTFGFYVQDDYRATPRLTLNLGLRYEFRTDISEQYGRESFLPDMHTSSAMVLGGPYRNPTHRDWSPRLGFAWDVFGTGKTAVRGGIGVYWDIQNVSIPLMQNSTGTLPFVANTTVQNTGREVLSLPLNLTGGSAGRSLQMGDYNIKSPYSLQYNLSVEQQLPGGLGLSLSYVGRRGNNLYTGVEGNPAVPDNLDAVLNNGAVPRYNVARAQAGCLNATIPVNDAGQPLPYSLSPSDLGYPCRVNPFWGSALFYTTGASSWYNGLQITVNKRLSRGLMIQSAYTYSRATDTTQGTRYADDCGGNPTAAFGRNPFDISANYAPSCFDVTHSAAISLLYHFPSISSNSFLSKAVNGWWMGNIVTIVTGTPTTAQTINDRSLSGIISQTSRDYVSLNTSSTPNLTSSPFIPYDPNTFIIGDPARWFNPYMLGVSELGVPGNSPRGIIRNPGTGEWNFSLVKDTRLGFLGEQGNLQFRAEFFNILNRPNFSYLNNGIQVFNVNTTTHCPTGADACDLFAPSGGAGVISETSTTSRQIQFTLRVSF